MLFKRIFGSAIVLSLAAAMSAQAESPVWKVTKGDQTIFVGGTIHMLSKSDYPLPEVFDRAYQQSQRLVFEIDADDINSLEAQQKMMQAALNTSGEKWVDKLSEETRKDLLEACTKLGMPVAMLNQFKPSFGLMSLTVFALQKKGMAGEGVEDYFTKQSKKDQKPVDGLETVEQQIAMLTMDWDSSLDHQVAVTLRELKQLDEQMADMVSSWRTGDLEKLQTLVVDTLKEFPEVYRVLLVDRNHDWVPKIEPMFETPEVEFVLVGAAHLLGDDGLLALLKEKGYKLEPVKP